MSHCDIWLKKFTVPGACMIVDLAQRGQVDVHPFAVVVGPEIVEPGVGNCFGVQRIRVEWAVGRHRRHHVADLLGLSAEAGTPKVIEVNYGCVGHSDLCYSEFRNDDRNRPTSRCAY